MVSAAPPSWQPVRRSPWPVDDGRRAFRHTQQCKLPFTAGRPSAVGHARQSARPCLWGTTAAADRGWPMRSLLRLTSDATRESLKCMATQLVNNERKKNCRRAYENAGCKTASSSGSSLCVAYEHRTISSIALGIAAGRLMLPSGFDRITDEWSVTQCAECTETAPTRCDYVDVGACSRPAAQSQCRCVASQVNATISRILLPRDAVHKRDLCCRAVSFCPSVCLSGVTHVGVLCRNE